MNETNLPPNVNPNVYLNYLQPSTATEYEVTRDIFFITFGALLWDILISVPVDWRLIRTNEPSFVLFAYFSSRTCALVVVVLSALTRTGPIRDCGAVELATCILWVLATGSSSYLFLKRVHAVFFQDRLVRHAFTIFWVATVGASTVLIVTPFHHYYEIADTQHCMNTKIEKYVSAGFFIPVVFDIIVYLSISFKILMSHRATTNRPGWRNLCYKHALPRISKAVLEGGQQYYLITTSVNVSRCIALMLPNSPPVLQLSPSILAVALTSAMACRVFRNLKFEALQKTEVDILTTIRFADKERDDVHVPKNAGVICVESGTEQC